MNWRIIKQFPKFVVVGAVFIISTGLFVFWWMTRKPATPEQPRTDYRKIEKARKVAALPDKMGWLALVGRDLYDINSGEKIFADWLGGMPRQIFYQPGDKRLIVRAERGFLRYGLDGSKESAMGVDSPPAFASDLSQAMFIKDGDIWLAEVDWSAFVFRNERQVTKFGQFSGSYFAENVKLFSKAAMVVRLQNKLLQVNLTSGDIQPIRIPQIAVQKRRSPNGRWMLGEDGGKLHLYDAESATPKLVASPNQRLQDVQWLDDERAVFITGSRSFSLYDRTKGAVVKSVMLPNDCSQVAQASPGGQYILCGGRKGISVVNLKTLETSDFGMPAQHFGWVNSDTLIYTRDVPVTEYRGTWLRTIGQEERLVIGEPYVAGRDGNGAVAPMREVEMIVFATKEAIYRMKDDGSELREVAKLPRPVSNILPVESLLNQP